MTQITILGHLQRPRPVRGIEKLTCCPAAGFDDCLSINILVCRSFQVLCNACFCDVHKLSFYQAKAVRTFISFDLRSRHSMTKQDRLHQRQSRPSSLPCSTAIISLLTLCKPAWMLHRNRMMVFLHPAGFELQAVFSACAVHTLDQAMGPVTVSVQPGGYAHVQLCSEPVNVMDLAMWQVGMLCTYFSPFKSACNGICSCNRPFSCCSPIT